MYDDSRSLGSLLIVDDDGDNREALQDLLEAAGYTVACAANGLDALEYLRSHSHPDLILADLVMPVMNGWVLALERNRDPRLAEIPLVVFSGCYDPASAAGFLDASDFLEKPLDVERLFEVIRRYCPRAAGMVPGVVGEPSSQEAQSVATAPNGSG